MGAELDTFTVLPSRFPHSVQLHLLLELGDALMPAVVP
jgi:hypothetical protein